MTRFDRLAVAKLAGLLLIVQFLPHLVLFLGFDTSLKVGTAMATLLILVVSLMTRVGVTTQPSGGDLQKIELGPIIVAGTIVLASVVHAAIANNFMAIDTSRLALTLPVLFLMVAASVSLARIMLNCSSAQLHGAVKVSTIFLVLCILLRISGLGPRGIFEKPVFPFSEPSHFALALAPILLYNCMSTSGRTRWMWLAAGFVIGLGIESLTLLIACLLGSIAARKFVYVLTGGVILAAGIIPFQLDYFVDRLDLSSETQNLSSLVYLQGWQQLWESLVRSRAWGLGFQQLGVHGTEVSSAAAINTIYNIEGLNIQDGSFVFAKLGSELGIFGLLLGAAFAITAARSFYLLRNSRQRPALLLAHSVVVCFIVDMFVRGTGYFTGSTLLALSALSVLIQHSVYDASGSLREKVIPRAMKHALR